VKQFNITWFIWLVLVIAWNFIWQEVPAIADVIVAVALSITFYQLNQKLKK